MIAYEHLNEGADLDRWRYLTESVLKKDPGASLKLHKEFEHGLKLLLRRQVSSVKLSGAIHKILADVTRTIVSDGLTSPDLLPALVRRAARHLIPLSAPRIETEVNVVPNVILQSILAQLPQNQRDALEMVYVDGADDQVVCALKGLTIRELTTIRASVRERFSTSQGSKTMSTRSEIS
jgi:hypothetical protein